MNPFLNQKGRSPLMTDGDDNVVPGTAGSGGDAKALPTTRTETEWAVRSTGRSNGEEWFSDCESGPAARRELERDTRFYPPSQWNNEVVSRIVMTSPWRPTPGEAPLGIQFAEVAEAATRKLHELAASGSLSPEDAAAVIGSLQRTLEHAAGIFTSRAVTEAHPYAAPNLKAAAIRVGGANAVINSAHDALGVGAQAAIRAAGDDFPVVNPLAAPGRTVGEPARPSSAARKGTAAEVPQKRGR
jgi:hypothetical protein